MKRKKLNLEAKAKEFYQSVLNCVEGLNENVKDLIEENLDKMKLIEVIKCEQKCDRLKEDYITRLFKEKRALPFMVEDRYKIITSLDSIADISEETARLIKIFPFKLIDEIKDDLRKLNQTCLEIVKNLINLVELMEDDFSTAYQRTFYIEILKRNAREYNYNILEILFQRTDKTLIIYLTSKLSVLLFDLVGAAEELSDYLRGLIVKYPAK